MKYLYCEPFAQTVPPVEPEPLSSGPGTNAGALLSLPQPTPIVTNVKTVHKLHLHHCSLFQSGGLCRSDESPTGARRSVGRAT
jgi:hypothetical protein